MLFSSIGVQLALHASLTLLMCVTCEPAAAQGTSIAKQTLLAGSASSISDIS